MSKSQQDTIASLRIELEDAQKQLMRFRLALEEVAVSRGGVMRGRPMDSISEFARKELARTQETPIATSARA